MCGCNDLKFAKKSHSHSQYLTTTELNQALSAYYTQAEVDALLANYYTKAEVDILIADLQSQIDDCNCGGCSEYEHQFNSQADIDEWSVVTGDWALNWANGIELRLAYNAGNTQNIKAEHLFASPIVVKANHQIEAIYHTNGNITYQEIGVIKSPGTELSDYRSFFTTIDNNEQTEQFGLVPTFAAGDIIIGVYAMANVSPGEQTASRLLINNLRIFCS